MDNLVMITVLLPILGAILIGLLAEDDRLARWIALGASLATLAAAVVMAVQFDPAGSVFQFAATYEWIPAIGANIAFGVDGIALVLIVLTAFITPLIVISSWHVTDRVKGYMSAFLVLEGAVIGVFTATDLLLFYVFFEFTLIPMYLIIGMWGGANRRYAAVKFFLYTLFGGLLMLVAILSLYAAAGGQSFSYDAIAQASLDLGQQRWLFGAFFAAFAVKVPLFPVHTWLPDAHTEAPTAGSVFLAAILLKMGAFGFLRYSLPLFPDATRELALGTGTGFFSVPWLLVLSVIGILYGAVVALVQKDVKKLVAYSSVSHMGFVVLGIFALNTTATSAGVVQMVNHGLSTGALFLLIGFLYERRHTREIAAFGGPRPPDPGVRRLLPGGRAVVAGPAGPQRLRRRVPDPAGHVPDAPGRRGAQRLRGGARGAVPAVGLPAGLPRPARGRRQPRDDGPELDRDRRDGPPGRPDRGDRHLPRPALRRGRARRRERAQQRLGGHAGR